MALIPKSYSSNINNVKTVGNFAVEGNIKGIIDEKHIPKFDIQINSENASFKYPDLPKSIENIYLNTTISNNSGISNDTKVNIEKLAFKIDEHHFNSSAFISNIVDNPKIQLKSNGTIDLKSISQAYPIKEIKEIQGIVKADFSASFDMNSIKQKKYQNIKNAGDLSIKNFKYEGSETANPIEIQDAKVSFSTKSVTLNNFNAKTGNSDLKMKGVINNFIGFIFNDEKSAREF